MVIKTLTGQTANMEKAGIKNKQKYVKIVSSIWALLPKFSSLSFLGPWTTCYVLMPTIHLCVPLFTQQIQHTYLNDPMYDLATVSSLQDWCKS